MFDHLICCVAPAVDLTKEPTCGRACDKDAPYRPKPHSVSNCSIGQFNPPVKSISSCSHRDDHSIGTSGLMAAVPPPSPMSDASSYLTPLADESFLLRRSSAASSAPSGAVSQRGGRHWDGVSTLSASGSVSQLSYCLSDGARMPSFTAADLSPVRIPDCSGRDGAAARRLPRLERLLITLDQDWNASDLLAFLYSDEIMHYEALGQLLVVRKILKNYNWSELVGIPYLYDRLKVIIFYWPMEPIDLDDANLGPLRELWRDDNEPFPIDNVNPNIIQPCGYAWWLLARRFLKYMPEANIHLVCQDIIFIIDTVWPQYKIGVIDRLIYYFHRLADANRPQVYDFMMQAIAGFDRPLANQLIGMLVDRLMEISKKQAH